MWCINIPLMNSTIGECPLPMMVGLVLIMVLFCDTELQIIKGLGIMGKPKNVEQ